MPAVICYEGLVIRDHWPQVTSCPWWMKRSPRIEDQIAWFREAVAAIGQDWFLLPYFYSCDERRHLRIEHRSDGPWLVDSRTGLEESLAAPVIGTGRVIINYVLNKIMDRDPFPEGAGLQEEPTAERAG